MTERLEPCPAVCKCGAQDFMLCEDHTTYSLMTYDADEQSWSHGYSHREASVADDAVRVFCRVCGEYYLPPELL